MLGRLWRINQLTTGIAGTSNLSVFSLPVLGGMR